MHVDERWPASAAIETDVCVVGAGPAGISVAREMAGGGLRVCLLEAGGEQVERRSQRDCRGQSDGYPIHRPDMSRTSAFGGTLRDPGLGDEGWAARPLDPIDFEVRDGMPYSGWPFGRTELDPYYLRAQRSCGLGAYDHTPDVWAGPGRTPLPLDRSLVDTTVFQFGPPPFPGALRELVAAPNVEVLLHSRVVGVTATDTSDRVESLTVARRDSTTLRIRPRVLVLAAGGIENARLLLLANGTRGLGNEHGLVGRFFAERLSLHAGHLLDPHGRAPEQAGFYELHHVGSTLIRGALTVSERLQRERGLLNCAFFVLPRPEPVCGDAVRSMATLRKAVSRRPAVPRIGRHLANAVTGAGDLAALATRRGPGARQRLVLRAQAEQAPNRSSRVTLGTRRDDYGLPLPRITWQMEDSDVASIERSLQVVGAALGGAGLGAVVSGLGGPGDRPLVEGNHHHLGTTRMHADPRLGVVDANCRVHSVSNLYVAGSSTFPTYGTSNPTLTIVAMAIRLADHLVGRFSTRRSRIGLGS